MRTILTTRIHRLSPLAAALALTLPSAGSLAQQASQQQQPLAQKEEPSKLEAVVVTANKRKENLMEVPAAISVLDAASLQRSSVKEMDDLPSLSPALTISYSTQPGNFSINMRGIGTFSLGIGIEADVAVILDDIPMAMQASAFKDLADVARVEVLKGPQSTMVGKSAIAGALNITTKPITDGTTANLLLTSDGEYRLGGSFGKVVSDQFRMRLAASSTDFPGVVKNLSDGGHLNGSSGKTLIGKFEWAPTEELTFTLAPRYNQQTKNCCVSPYTQFTNFAGAQYSAANFNIAGNATNWANANLAARNLIGGIPIGPNNVSVRNNFPAGGKSTDYGTGFRVDYAPTAGPLAQHTLSSITSYSKYKMNDYQDGDALDQNILQYSSTPALATQYADGPVQYGSFGVKAVTQEFRLVSPDQQGLRYVAGLFYAKNNLSRSLIRVPVETASYATNYSTNAYNTNYAAFGQATLDLTDSTSLVGGLRYNREDTGYEFTRTVPTAFQSARNDSDNSTTGKLGLEHRFNKDVMAYGLFSTGYKGVAYDLVSGLTAAQAAEFPVPPETAKNFEIGTKAMLLDNRASVSVAVFKTDFKHFQQSASHMDPNTGLFVTTLTSVGGMQTKGIEVDGSIRVSRDLTLNGSLAYTKAIYTDFPNGPCYSVLNAAGNGTTPGPGCLVRTAAQGGNIRDMAGLPLPNAPKYKFNIGGNYNIALPGQSFNAFVNGVYRWQDDVLFAHNQDPVGVTQKAYGILDAAFGLKDKKGGYTITIFAKNLLDKVYANGLQYQPRHGNWSTSTVNVITQQWTPPRDYTRYFGAKLDLSF